MLQGDLIDTAATTCAAGAILGRAVEIPCLVEDQAGAGKSSRMTGEAVHHSFVPPAVGVQC